VQRGKAEIPLLHPVAVSQLPWVGEWEEQVKNMRVMIGLLCMFCLGCFCLPRQNTAKLTKGNLRADGNINRRGDISIVSIEIGTPDDRFDDRFEFSIRLDSGRVIHSREFTRDLVDSIADPPGLRIRRVGETKGFVYAYVGGGTIFEFDGEQLVTFAARKMTPPGGDFSTTLGDASSETFFRMPLTVEQFELLFGKPEKVMRWFMW
jgi:hypothetical protein